MFVVFYRRLGIQSCDAPRIAALCENVTSFTKPKVHPYRKTSPVEDRMIEGQGQRSRLKLGSGVSVRDAVGGTSILNRGQFLVAACIYA